MQDEYKDIETQVLIDMLAKHTENYTRLMTEGLKEEFEQCKQTIATLQKEINSRQLNSKEANS